MPLSETADVRSGRGLSEDGDRQRPREEPQLGLQADRPVRYMLAAPKVNARPRTTKADQQTAPLIVRPKCGISLSVSIFSIASLVDRTGVKFETIEDWRGAVMNLPETLSSVSRTLEEIDPRIAIFLLWRHLALAPSTIQHHYSLIAEKEIRQAASVFEEAFSSPGFGLEIYAKDDNREIVRKVGGLLRALEIVFTQEDLGGRHSDLNDDWAVSWGEEQAFFIPMARVAWREPKPEESDYRPFEQRGLVRIRIVPTKIDGATVRLYRPDRVARSAGRIAFGASLFPGTVFEETVSDKRFRITGFDATALNDHIAEACEGAHVAGCLATVFPELTINDVSLKEMRRLLGDKPWLDAQIGELKTPVIVVAGSWHEPWRKGFCNVATVLDGDGELILSHRKRYAYRDEQGRAEDIIPGEELAILVLNEGLFAFGICLDFCHRCFSTPYGNLDVDFVLVPSCGNAATMNGHIRTAADLLDRRKARSFVVQQAYPALADGLGYVLPPGSIQSGCAAEDLVRKDAWNVFFALISDPS